MSTPKTNSPLILELLDRVIATPTQIDITLRNDSTAWTGFPLSYDADWLRLAETQEVGSSWGLIRLSDIVGITIAATKLPNGDTKADVLN